jgi:uncharacterized membrane protein
MKTLRKTFFTGLFILIPIIITLSLIVWFFNRVDAIFRGPIEKMIGIKLIGIGILITLSVIFITGMIATNYLGKKIILFMEKTISKIPLVSTIYISIKQLIDTIFMKRNDAFKNVVLVEYPSRGIFAIGFITADAPENVSKKVGEKMKSIFIPTTPNPTSGMLIMVPVKNIIPLDMPVEVAIKLVVSGGILGSGDFKN